MTWKLWLDDQADDPNYPSRKTPEGYVAARTAEEALACVKERGLPEAMDLDHDLGTGNAMEFVRGLVRLHPDGPVPPYTIHSENPEGRKNMTAYLESWKKTLERAPGAHGYVRAADILTEVYGQEIKATFSIDADEWAKIQVFLDEHRKLHKGKDGAIGGRFTYSFTPTTLFTKVTCHCACGAEVDATNYGSV